MVETPLPFVYLSSYKPEKSLEEIQELIGAGIRRGVSGDRILETKLGALIREDLHRKYENHIWIETSVKLRNFLPANKFKSRIDHYKEILEKYGPLQPDIDLLMGPIEKGVKKSPLCAFEMKIFTRDRKNYIIPKKGGGFYIGLEQALALLYFGVNFVGLLHFFFFPYEKLRQLGNKTSSQMEIDEFENNIIEYDSCYQGIIRGLINALCLPISYLPFFVSVDMKRKSIVISPPRGLESQLKVTFNPLFYNKIPSNVRRLIIDKCDITF